MKVYVVMGNDRPECVLADEEAAKEYVAYRKELNDQRRSGRGVYWCYYDFDLIYGQYR